jgi:peptide/nickel transport system permease protein
MMTAAATPKSPIPRRPRPRAHVRWGMFVPLALVMLVAAVGPVFLPYDPVEIAGVPSTPPNSEFWFGLDSNGMDVFSRTIAATRINLIIAVSATLLSTGIGVVLGVVAGMNEAGKGPRVVAARGLARSLDIVDAIPSVVIGLVLVALLGPSMWTIIAALTLVAIPRQAKLVRAETFRVRFEPYVDSARQAGRSEPSVVVRTILPNAVPPALENMSAVFGLSIIVTAALGFLGVGMPPPTPEWGTMIATGSADALNLRWWAAAFPTLALMLTVASVALATSEILRPRH